MWEADRCGIANGCGRSAMRRRRGRARTRFCLRRGETSANGRLRTFQFELTETRSRTGVWFADADDCRGTLCPVDLEAPQWRARRDGFGGTLVSDRFWVQGSAQVAVGGCSGLWRGTATCAAPKKRNNPLRYDGSPTANSVQFRGCTNGTVFPRFKGRSYEMLINRTDRVLCRLLPPRFASLKPRAPSQPHLLPVARYTILPSITRSNSYRKTCG